MPENMFSQTMLVQWTFVLILYTRLYSGVHAVSDACNICNCDSPGKVDCNKRQLTSVPTNIPPNTTVLHLRFNGITTISKGSFAGLSQLQTIHLGSNSIRQIENGSFSSLYNLKKLHLRHNNIRNVENGSFADLFNLETLNLSNNPSLRCGCQLPTMVKCMKNIYNRSINVSGKCFMPKGKSIPILTYSQILGFCRVDSTTSKDGAWNWPRTREGTKATIPCHANVATRFCSSRAVNHLERTLNQCMTSVKCPPFTGFWQEPDMSQCNNTEWITRRLKDLRSQSIDRGNIDSILKEFLDVSQKSVYFKEQDIDLAVGILEKMVPLISNVSANITRSNALLGISNMINTPEKVLAEAERANRGTNRLLDIIETIPERIPLDELVKVSKPNFGIGVAKVNKYTFNGLFYGVSYGTNDTEGSLLLYNHPYPDAQQEHIKTVASISIPKSLPEQLKDEEKSALSRILFVSMRDDKLYRAMQNTRANGNAKINSYVLVASVPNVSLKNLDEQIIISFNLLNQNADNPKCVYWDDTAGEVPHWSTNGCNISSYVLGKEVVCSCDHLTSFALLMDVHRNEAEVRNVKALSIISLTGCGISFVFLVLTIIIHVCFRNLRNLLTSKILVSLCVPLAVANLIFVVGMQPDVEETLAACKAVAALLHYFLLTSLIWTCFEAIHVFVSMVVVFKTYQTSFMKKSSIVAWGFPAVIVVITLIINSTDNYVKIEGQVCWLSDTYFYATFLVPVIIILIFNLTIFSFIIWRLISMQNNNKKFGQQRRKVRVVGIVGLFFLLGLTWVLAFFAVGPAAKVLKFLFAIFNTLQGMFIFIFYCICKKDTRDVVMKYFSTRKRATFSHQLK